MKKQISKEDRECLRYGRTARGATVELRELHEAFFSQEGSGNIMDVYEHIHGDIGLVVFLDDIAIARMPAEDRQFLSSTDYHRRERVEKMLLDDKRLPKELFNY